MKPPSSTIHGAALTLLLLLCVLHFLPEAIHIIQICTESQSLQRPNDVIWDDGGLFLFLAQAVGF